MRILGLDINFPTFTRQENGDYRYDITSFNEWSCNSSNLGLAQDHSILSPAMLFISKLFSQAKFDVINSTSKKPSNSHPNLKLLKSPNYDQTTSDFLESLIFTKIANGTGVVWKKKTFGSSIVNSLYVLDFNLIKFPSEVMSIGKYPNRSASSKRASIEVVYDENGENIKIKLDDLIFFYDMPNGLDKGNIYKSRSRIEGIKQTLYNTEDSEIAKSIIIKSNGKEMISSQKSAFPFTPGEKERVENNASQKYGLGSGRKRTIVSQASLKWQSMHIIMRDLGHDEGTKTDAGIIFAALHLPRDIYSIDGIKSAYKNVNQSLVSYIQNEMQSILEGVIQKLNASLFEDNDNYEFVGSYEHLPVMLAFKTIQIENAKKQAEALSALRMSGVSDELAVELSGLPAGTKLEPLVIAPTTTGNEKKETE
jgi:hypothetical protein